MDARPHQRQRISRRNSRTCSWLMAKPSPASVPSRCPQMNDPRRPCRHRRVVTTPHPGRGIAGGFAGDGVRICRSRRRERRAMARGGVLVGGGGPTHRMTRMVCQSAGNSSGGHEHRLPALRVPAMNPTLRPSGWMNGGAGQALGSPRTGNHWLASPLLANPSPAAQLPAGGQAWFRGSGEGWPTGNHR